MSFMGADRFNGFTGGSGLLGLGIQSATYNPASPIDYRTANALMQFGTLAATEFYRTTYGDNYGKSLTPDTTLASVFNNQPIPQWTVLLRATLTESDNAMLGLANIDSADFNAGIPYTPQTSVCIVGPHTMSHIAQGGEPVGMVSTEQKVFGQTARGALYFIIDLETAAISGQQQLVVSAMSKAFMQAPQAFTIESIAKCILLSMDTVARASLGYSQDVDPSRVIMRFISSFFIANKSEKMWPLIIEHFKWVRDYGRTHGVPPIEKIILDISMRYQLRMGSSVATDPLKVGSPGETANYNGDVSVGTPEGIQVIFTRPTTYENANAFEFLENKATLSQFYKSVNPNGRSTSFCIPHWPYRYEEVSIEKLIRADLHYKSDGSLNKELLENIMAMEPAFTGTSRLCTFTEISANGSTRRVASPFITLSARGDTKIAKFFGEFADEFASDDAFMRKAMENARIFKKKAGMKDVLERWENFSKSADVSAKNAFKKLGECIRRIYTDSHPVVKKIVANSHNTRYRHPFGGRFSDAIDGAVRMGRNAGSYIATAAGYAKQKALDAANSQTMGYALSAAGYAGRKAYDVATSPITASITSLAVGAGMAATTMSAKVAFYLGKLSYNAATSSMSQSAMSTAIRGGIKAAKGVVSGASSAGSAALGLFNSSTHAISSASEALMFGGSAPAGMPEPVPASGSSTSAATLHQEWIAYVSSKMVDALNNVSSVDNDLLDAIIRAVVAYFEHRPYDQFSNWFFSSSTAADFMREVLDSVDRLTRTSGGVTGIEDHVSSFLKTWEELYFSVESHELLDEASQSEEDDDENEDGIPPYHADGMPHTGHVGGHIHAAFPMYFPSDVKSPNQQLKRRLEIADGISDVAERLFYMLAILQPTNRNDSMINEAKEKMWVTLRYAVFDYMQTFATSAGIASTAQPVETTVYGPIVSGETNPQRSKVVVSSCMKVSSIIPDPARLTGIGNMNCRGMLPFSNEILSCGNHEDISSLCDNVANLVNQQVGARVVVSYGCDSDFGLNGAISINGEAPFLNCHYNMRNTALRDTAMFRFPAAGVLAFVISGCDYNIRDASTLEENFRSGLNSGNIAFRGPSQWFDERAARWVMDFGNTPIGNIDFSETCHRVLDGSPGLLTAERRVFPHDDPRPQY